MAKYNVIVELLGTYEIEVEADSVDEAREIVDHQLNVDGVDDASDWELSDFYVVQDK